MNNFTVVEIKFQSKTPISSDKIWSGNTDNANYAQADKRQGYWSGSNLSHTMWFSRYLVPLLISH